MSLIDLTHTTIPVGGQEVTQNISIETDQIDAIYGVTGRPGTTIEYAGHRTTVVVEPYEVVKALIDGVELEEELDTESGSY